VSVLVGNGDGTFAARQNFAGGDSHQGHQDLALGDFNGDGFPDVASANFNTPTVSIEFDQFSQIALQLLDAGGTVLQTAAPGPTNLDLVLSDFVAPADGTYFARLTGAGVPRTFALVITRGADFDTHPNGTFATAQDITGTVGALGAIVPAGPGASADWYRVTATDGQTLFFDTSVPSSGPGQFTNNLQPHIELYDPSGVLVAGGVVQADGRNEAITFTVAAGAAGAYRVQITGKSGTTGEYFLDPVESGGPRAAVLPPAGGAANSRGTARTAVDVLTVPAGAAHASRVRITGKSGTTSEQVLEPVEGGGLRAGALPPAGGPATSRGTGLFVMDVLSPLAVPSAPGAIPAAGGNPTAPPAGPGKVPANGHAVPAPLAEPGLAARAVGLSPWAIDQLFADCSDSVDWGDGPGGWPTGKWSRSGGAATARVGRVP
jgi:hypothetical protein